MTTDPNSAEFAQEVAAGYTFDGPTLKLGALVQGADATESAQVAIPLAMLNRHGLVAGATGTGKTRTLQLMAEGLSEQGVPVFAADIKGDLTGMAIDGEPQDFIAKRAADIGQDWSPASYPMEFYSLGGIGTGVPIRTTVTDFGPLLLSKVLGLNDTQESSLSLIFHWADTNKLALLDLKDLRSVIAYLTSKEGKDELQGIGGVSPATAGVILREISALETQGAEEFFGEPAFDTKDLLAVGADGRGVISALELPSLQDRPALFSTFLMWLLADLFADLPEVGDLDKPKLVFFFDEAHLLFTDASKEFLTQVTQTVRLIRSKGVGVFFVTQSPKDIPADVLGQLGSRVQHALRAFTPQDADALKAAVRTYPTSPYDLEKVLTSLATGEAVVTVLSEKGAPTPVAWTRLRAPRGSMDAAPAEAVTAVINASDGEAKYAVETDRESAYELLAARVEASSAAAAAAAQAEAQAKADAAAKKAEAAPRRTSTKKDKSVVEEILTSSTTKSLARSAGRELINQISRSIFGTRGR
ncbi:MAG: DUF853 domain-containing protein [Demequina sp.]|nr:DUF853 domain-containing protein [Demequina sp.]